MKKILSFISCSIIVFITSCSYGDFTIHRINDKNNFYNYYLFERNNENKNEDLIIYLDGSTMHSSLGLKGSILPWKSISPAYILQKKLSKNFDFLVPERMNMEIGKDYNNDTLRLREYTLKNRTETAVKCINEIIKQNLYLNIYIIGYSEGSLILPKIYNNLDNKKSIKKLISISGGGYVYYDMIKATLIERGLSQHFIDSTIAEYKKDPNSVTKFAFGHPNNKWNDFLYYDPLEEYKKIDIPILVIHGDADKNGPVEASRYLKRKFDELGKKNLEYLEVKNGDHHFEDQYEQVITEIEKFIKK